jgi:hypothetical protein
VALFSHNAEGHYAECHYAECHLAECHRADCDYKLFIIATAIVLRS